MKYKLTNPFVNGYGLPPQYAEELIKDPKRCEYFEQAVEVAWRMGVLKPNDRD